MARQVLPTGIYGILAADLSKGRSNIEVAEAMIKGGISVIQYRDKDTMSKKKQYEECKQIRIMTADAGVLFLINDFIDIALLVDADGVHIGQDDIPLEQARKLLGHKIIGLSTHSPEQAHAAVEQGADYIGVGPLFPTQTKIHPEGQVGLDYLDYVVKNIDCDFVAIGGIKKHNMESVIKKGAHSLCLVSAITEAPHIASEVLDLNKVFKSLRH